MILLLLILREINFKLVVLMNEKAIFFFLVGEKKKVENGDAGP